MNVFETINPAFSAYDLEDGDMGRCQGLLYTGSLERCRQRCGVTRD